MKYWEREGDVRLFSTLIKLEKKNHHKESIVEKIKTDWQIWSFDPFTLTSERISYNINTISSRQAMRRKKIL